MLMIGVVAAAAGEEVVAEVIIGEPQRIPTGWRDKIISPGIIRPV
jgi:hypothetical protein